MLLASAVWLCCGCGAASPNRVRSCDCPTGCLYRRAGGIIVHEVKVANVKDRTSLSRLRQAIIDNTKGDLFWIGEILLAELAKETGYNGDGEVGTKENG